MVRRGQKTRWLPQSVGQGMLIVAVGCGAAAACSEALGEDPLLAEGRVQYDQYCALCHGTSGEGYQSDQANALSNQQFLAIATDELLRSGTARGRPGTPMSPYGDVKGGPLTAYQVDAVVAYIRSWQTVPSQDVHVLEVDGSLQRALPLYEFYCAECHGIDGGGHQYMSLNNPEFLAVVSDGFLREATAKGREGTEMPGFDRELTAQGIDDLVVLMRSWETPVDDTPYQPPSKDLGEVFINPGGPEPPFEPEGRFQGVDDVKQAIDDGCELALLDARPPSAYVQSHITGARSVPSYLAAEYLDQLPKDHWYITYCACPHSISGELLDFLKANGYPKVKVLDEGFLVWADRGYPTTSGPNPY